MKQNRTIRLFVSSTFSDMKAERDILQDKVFPRLQQHCLANGLRFQAIDLRWGVPEEAGKDNRTMRICLRELKRCQEGPIKPNFLVLLGDRYGWRPLPENIPADLFGRLRDEMSAETQSLLEWQEDQPAGGKGGYRRDDNAVPPMYELQPRGEDVIDWHDTVENSILTALIQAAAALRADPSLPADLRSTLESVAIGTSATEQEIRHGALALDPDEVRHHVHTFSRTITDAPKPPHHAFTDLLSDGSLNTRSRDQLKNLKSELKKHLGGETNFHNYNVPWRGDGGLIAADLESFAASVFDCLTQVIDDQVAVLQEIALEEQEEQAHHAFCEDRRAGFLGRGEPLVAIESYLRDGPSQPLAIVGPAGSGKSALMAEAVHRARESPQSEIQNPQSEIVLARFLGVTPGSSDLIQLLRDLVGQIRKRYPRDQQQRGTSGPPVPGEANQDERQPSDHEIPFEINPLTNAFHEALARTTPEQPLWLFLDALDQFRDANLASSLSWLPSKLPSNVRIIVSTASRSVGISPTSSNEASTSTISNPPSKIPSDPRSLILRNLSRLCPGTQTIQIDPLTPADGKALLIHWLTAAGRKLHESQQKPILAAFAVEGNALWLRVAAEEAARWPRWHTPEPPPPGLHELLATVLERLSRNEEHGAVFVKRALGYLACARHGLAEDEIIGVLGADTFVMPDILARSPTERVKAEADRIKALPVAIWVRFYGDIAFYLSERRNQGAALFGFYHRSFGEAVERFCLKTDADRLPLHETMAQWFGKQPWFLPPAGEDGQPPRAPERSDPANTRKASELPFHLHRVAELTPNADRWDPLVDVLCDLDCVETKARSGLLYELVSDYNEALAALPEFAEENERLAKRDAAMIAYNKALREYAVVRCDWWFAKERGEVRPEPPYPPMPEELRNEAHHAIAEETSPRAACLRHFSNFVSGQLAPLAQFPAEALPLAYNWAAEGPVAAQAEMQIQSRSLPCLKRSPRPPRHFRPQCLRTLEGHTRGVRSVSFSPDARRAVSGSLDKTVRVWDLETGECLHTLAGHSYVECVSVCSDARCAVSGSWDKTLRLWNLDTGECLRTLAGHSDKVWSVSASPDGRRAVSASKDSTVRVWDLETGECLRILVGHTSDVTSVSVNPDGRRAVSGSWDYSVRVWDLETGACLRTLEGHSLSVNSVSVSPDGRRAASGSLDDTVRIWDLETGACLQTLEGHRNEVRSVSISSDGRYAVSGSRDKTIRRWDIETGACLCSLEGHSTKVNSVSVSPDGRYAISVAGELSRSDCALRLWDLETDACLRTLEGHGSSVASVSVSPDGRRAVSGSWDNTIRLWDMETGACLHTLESFFVSGVSVSPDGRRAVSGSGDKTVRLWDLEAHACLRTLVGHTSDVESVSVSPDGRRAVSGSKDSTVRVWDLETGACLRTLEGHRNGVTSVSVSPDGRRAVSGSDDKIVLWDLETGACLRTLVGHSYTECVSFCSDARLAVSWSWGTNVLVWDLETGECLRTLEGHTGTVTSVCVSSDGRRAVSGSSDNTVRFWNLEKNTCLAVYHTDDFVESAALSPDGSRIICGTKDGQMHFLTPVNFPPSGPPILTPVRLWLFGDNGAPGRWDEHLTALCPWCGRRFPVRDDMLGRQIACPLDSCGKPLVFNPFVVDSGKNRNEA